MIRILKIENARVVKTPVCQSIISKENSNITSKERHLCLRQTTYCVCRLLTRLESNTRRNPPNAATNQTRRSRNASLTMTYNIISLIRQHTWYTELHERNPYIRAKQSRASSFSKCGNQHAGGGERLVQCYERAPHVVTVCEPRASEGEECGDDVGGRGK